jgi:GAF domain-containing protein
VSVDVIRSDGWSLSERQLLQSVVEVALNVFGAAAASVLLTDPGSGDLVFAAVAGAGDLSLPGTRFPAGTGIAGLVVASGEPVLADDVNEVPEFARSAAEGTGYVPRSIMAAPLVLEGECIGVLEVLDRGITDDRSGLADLDLLAVLAAQAALSAGLLIRQEWLRGAGSGAVPEDSCVALLRRIGLRLPQADESLTATVVRLLVTADELLSVPV